MVQSVWAVPAVCVGGATEVSGWTVPRFLPLVPPNEKAARRPPVDSVVVKWFIYNEIE